jgi:C4-dicarboxylate transporter DctM subunit
LSPIAIAGILILLFIILMFLKMPIAVCMILIGFTGLVLMRGLPAALPALGNITFRTGASYDLSVIALFVWMGMLSSYGGIAKDAFTAINKWVGHLYGGLAMATVGACAAFGAVCGSHVATALTMCSIALPQMRKFGYNDQFSLGCISAAGNLGILIPPSTAFIVYGFITEQSIGALFIAGILPGLLLVILFWTYIYVSCRINVKIAPLALKTNWTDRFVGLKGLWGVMAVFIIVMGGLYTGVFTPTEGGAVGVFAVLLISLIGRRLKRQGFVQSLLETAVVSAMILFLIMGAKIFGTFIASTNLATSLANLITLLSLNRWIIMTAILIFYVVLGFILDIFAILIISLPIVFPIITSLSFDPIYFGVLAILSVMLGSVTPPFGIIVFAVHGMNREVPLFTIFRGVMPFVYVMLLCLAILAVVPQISLILPNLMMPYR